MNKNYIDIKNFVNPPNRSIQLPILSNMLSHVFDICSCNIDSKIFINSVFIVILKQILSHLTLTLYIQIFSIGFRSGYMLANLLQQYYFHNKTSMHLESTEFLHYPFVDRFFPLYLFHSFLIDIFQDLDIFIV